MFEHHSLTVAVIPVLVGPLQTLLALLPAILAGLGSLLFALLKPATFVKLIRFCWRQKLFFVMVAAVGYAWHAGYLTGWASTKAASSQALDVTEWPCARGSLLRTGSAAKVIDPTLGKLVWKNAHDKSIYSSPAITGNRIVFATATDIGPFSPEGKGAIVCVDASSGEELWRYAPKGFRATFSSPVISGDVIVCGEGLHQVEDARMTCLDAHTGRLVWQFRTKSHVESTPAIAEGRVFVGAGSDGFYCLALNPEPDGRPKVLWHLKGEDYPDCESSPVVSDGVVYFGLGEGGSAVCAVRMETGDLMWKVSTPYPVFAPPTISNGKLYVATGNGNFVQSAADLLEMKLQILRDDGASEQQIAEAREKLKPVGELWCLDLETHQVDWKFETGDAILGAAACDDTGIYFGSRDGHLNRISKSGELLVRYDLHEPLISSPALGQRVVSCSTASGRLYCLDKQSLSPLWDYSLGKGELFVSSPTMAHGHVYIGTAQEGLVCVGQPGELKPPLWSHGIPAHSPEVFAVPETADDLWYFPGKELELDVTAPLMPLGNFLYVAAKNGNQTDFICLNNRSLDALNLPVWTRTFEGQIVRGPVGYGDRLFFVETLNDGRDVRIHSLACSNGESLWQTSIEGFIGPTLLNEVVDGLFLDAARFLLLPGDSTVRCLNPKDGSVLWRWPVETTIQENVSAALAGDFVVIRANFYIEGHEVTEITTLDAQSGIELSRFRIPGHSFLSPVVTGETVEILQTGKPVILSLIDGHILQKSSSAFDALRMKTTGGRSRMKIAGVTQVVTQDERIYLVVEKSGVLCLGARDR